MSHLDDYVWSVIIKEKNWRRLVLSAKEHDDVQNHQNLTQENGSLSLSQDKSPKCSSYTLR